MQCMVCGADMRLEKVERAETMMVAGYEFHTFACSECQDIERRLTFSHEPTPQPDQLLQADTAKPAAPPSPDRDNTSPSFLFPTVPDKATSLVSLPSTDEVNSAQSVAPPPTDQSEPLSPSSTDHDEAEPSVSPASTDQSEPVSSGYPPSTDEALPSSRWARAIAKLRRRHS
jgi:hypothetical protein